MLRIKLGAGLIVIALIFSAVDKLNKSANYDPVLAQITYVSSSCYLQKEDRGVVTKTTTTTDKVSCETARKLHASHPAYTDMQVKGTVEAAFTYVSPVDNASHRGTLTYPYEKYGKVAELSLGDKLPILAHKSHADKFDRDYDHMENLASSH